MKLRVNIDDSRFRKRLADISRKVTAKTFMPQVRKATRNVLKTCVRLTPIRDYSIIRKNQSKQYKNRVNYIPSIHTRDDPWLLILPGKHMLFCNGTWYFASGHRLPPEIYNVYQQLLGEHYRRMQTKLAPFIAMRAQSRFLYVKSWWQVGQSLGIPVSVPPQAKIAHSRHNPRKEPPRGYGQWRGGQHVLSVDIRNPFLDQPSRYKPFSGKLILQAAIRENYPEFMRDIEAEMRRIVR